MKKRTLTAGTILLCLSAISFGQNSIKDFLHQNPQFFGGTDAVRQGGFAAAGTPGNAYDLHIRPPPRGTPRHGSGGYTRPWKRHR